MARRFNTTDNLKEFNDEHTFLCNMDGEINDTVTTLSFQLKIKGHFVKINVPLVTLLSKEIAATRFRKKSGMQPNFANSLKNYTNLKTVWFL